LSEVAQRVMIEVDEEGAEAGAADAVMSPLMRGTDDGLHLVVDKPIVYAPRDKGLTVIAGHVGQPPTGKTA
jgi:serine protease inhibitor